jgi:uncharacterized heparinase superfamily protein
MPRKDKKVVDDWCRLFDQTMSNIAWCNLCNIAPISDVNLPVYLVLM